MRETQKTARNILVLVNAVIAVGAFILKIVNPVVVSYTEDIRKADLFNFLVFTPLIMVILTVLLRRSLRPVVRLSAIGDALTREQAQELRTVAFNLPLRVLLLFNLVILSIVGLVALGFDAIVFPFYPFYKRFISMGLIWSYTVCSSLAVYVYVKRKMVPLLRRTSGIAADIGRRSSIRAGMVATMLTLAATILLFLSVYGYSKTREAMIRDDEESANALLFSVRETASACHSLLSLKQHIGSLSTPLPLSLVESSGNVLAVSQTHAPAQPQEGPFRAAAAGGSDRAMRKRLPLDGPFNGLSLAASYRIDQGSHDAMRNITIFYFVIGAFFLVFAGIISYSVASETSLALTDIRERMDRIAKGEEDLYREFEVVSLDEVGDLTRSFNELQRTVQHQNRLVKELEEKRHLIEKTNILMDLHDGIGGITTNIGILAELAQKEPDPDKARKMLTTISRLARDGVTEIRGFLQSLDTSGMSWDMLAAELKNQGSKMTEPHSISFSISSSLDVVQDLPESVLWTSLFKIYKEALTNIIKHSNARSVSVALDLTRIGLRLVIQDDGIGCPTDTKTGRGLANMRKRADEIGARLTISTERGTRVTLEVPLPLKFPGA